MVSNIRAVMDRVLVRLDKAENTSPGGVMLNPFANRERNVGTVESIGEDVTSVKVGDKVLFHCFDELPVLENDLAVIRERSLLGIFIADNN